jgi:hypothetical protein
VLSMLEEIGRVENIHSAIEKVNSGGGGGGGAGCGDDGGDDVVT